MVDKIMGYTKIGMCCKSPIVHDGEDRMNTKTENFDLMYLYEQTKLLFPEKNDCASLNDLEKIGYVS